MPDRFDEIAREWWDANRGYKDGDEWRASLAALLRREVERAAADMRERAAELADQFPEDFGNTAEGANISTWGEGVSEGFWHAIFKYRDAIRALSTAPEPGKPISLPPDDAWLPQGSPEEIARHIMHDTPRGLSLDYYAKLIALAIRRERRESEPGKETT